jgi:hypothetical protein
LFSKTAFLHGFALRGDTRLPLFAITTFQELSKLSSEERFIS